MKPIVLLLCVLVYSTTVFTQKLPYRPDADFELNLDYDFKVKTMPDQDVINFVEEQSPTPLPHLTIYISVLNRKEEEERIKIVDNKSQNRYNGKIKETPVRLVLGFTDDMKEGITGSKFFITIATKKRVGLNQIVLEVLPDGTFLVNGKINGKL